MQLSEWATEGKRSDTEPNGSVKTKTEMAKEAGVGTTTIERAKRVAKSGSKALKAAVKDGKITVDKAAEIAKLPIEEQAAAIKAAADSHRLRQYVQRWVSWLHGGLQGAVTENRFNQIWSYVNLNLYLDETGSYSAPFTSARGDAGLSPK